MRTPTAIAALPMSLAALSACISYDVIPAAELATRIRRVAFADIAQIERRRVAWGRTAYAVGGGALIVLAALSLAILAVFAT